MAMISLLLQLFFIILLPPSTAKKQCIEHEKTLLLELKNQLVFNSSHSTKLVQWSDETNDDCCRWNGVACDDAGHVIGLRLGGESISGGFNESSSLFSLNYLEELDLQDNLLVESQIIPRAIHKLTHLTSLILSSCSLKGYVSEILFQSPTLQFLDLSFNPFLSGVIPQIPENNSFTDIVLSYTNFSGSLPDSIGNLKGLYKLQLAGCKFSGAIPSTLSNLTLLNYVDLSNNFFTGSISSHHFEGISSDGSTYNTIDLSSNSLSGTIPTSIITLPSLWQLDLSRNQFSGQLSEFSIPNVSYLNSLDLSSNRLESPIPNSFSKLDSLEDLDLSMNLFNETFQLEKILNIPLLEYLDLSNNNLSLEATSSNKFSVKESYLDHLDLSNNKIAGEIPSWIWEIGDGTLHYLNLSCNRLVDLQKPRTIPTSISLHVLDLHSNQLRGEWPLPPQAASYVDYSNNCFDKSSLNTEGFSSDILEFLSIANNNLSGPFPTYICSLTTLRILDLSANNLSGSIPSCLFENIKDLQVLNLGRNNINGRIPDKFSPNCDLRTLDVSHNNLVGEVPLSLENCTSLAVMNVGNNHIDGNFPCMLPSALQVLVLRSNRFHGEMRCHKSWPNLQIIDIASNNFSGYLNPFNFSSWKGMVLDGDSDTEVARINLGVMTDITGYYYYRDEVTLTIKGLELKLVKIWPEFTSIDVSCNNFHGDIPKAIGELNSLYLLNLSHNALTGVIPKSFGKLSQLGSLDLSMNLLTGEIPHEIARLTFLVVMDVSYNKLVGKIPLGSQIQTFSADSFKGNIGLCGLPLSISCTNTSPQTHGNVGSDRENNIEWDYVFGAAGFAVGIGSFSWVLLFCPSLRHKYFEKIEDVFERAFERRQNRKRRHGGRRVVRNQVRRQ